MSDLWPAVGGMLHFEYRFGDADPPHPIHLAVAPFDATPHGPDGDYLYTGTGPTGRPTEPGILGTAAAIGALWAPYYESDWWLNLVGVAQLVDGFCVLLPLPRNARSTQGAYQDNGVFTGSFERTLHLYSSGPDQRWRIWLRQISDNRWGKTVKVSGQTGGYDVRDQAWYAYLGGTDTGIVARDGWRFQAGGQVRQWPDVAIPDPLYDVERIT